MGCLGKYKLPETTRKAHKLVNQLRRGEVEEGYMENLLQQMEKTKMTNQAV